PILNLNRNSLLFAYLKPEANQAYETNIEQMIMAFYEYPIYLPYYDSRDMLQRSYEQLLNIVKALGICQAQNYHASITSLMSGHLKLMW
ncbi:12865_t:CDS:1, partial [Cetraspora pellucida]